MPTGPIRPSRPPLPPRRKIFPSFLRRVLRALSLLAPTNLRDRWRREWEGEILNWWTKQGPGQWEEGIAGRGTPPSRLRLTGLLASAARDALHLRSLGGRPGLDPPGSTSIQTQRRPMLRPMLQDLRFALRTLRKAPWFSLVTLSTLALGIGASVAMFSVLHAVFLRPLPFPEEDRLVVGRTTVQGQLNPWVTGADYYDFRDGSRSFQELAAVGPFPEDLTVSGGGEAERVSGNVAAPNLFQALRVPPAMGRIFRPQDGLEGAQDVVLLTHAFWLRRFGGNPDILGTALTLDGSPYTIVGVLPPNFFFMSPADLWLPMRPDRFAAGSRDMHNWYLVGRLGEGVTLDQAQSDVEVIAARLREAYPETNRDKGLLLTGLREVLTEEYRGSLWILTGAALLVLLIACGNGAGILLARAPARSFELSVRGALGAPRGRLVRQLLAESVGLALAGGIVGTGLAFWFQGAMLQYLDINRLGLDEARLSLPMLVAALGLSLLAGLLAGVYPALRSAGTPLTGGLKEGNRGKGDGGAGFRGGLVVAQVALSVFLLAGSGLLVRSLSNLQALDPGFHAEGLLTGEIQMPAGRYPDAMSRGRYLSSLLEELRSIPGVQSATLTSQLPIGDFGNIYRAWAQGREDERQRVFLRSVYPGYFETLGIPLLSGRDFQDEGTPGGPFGVVLGETAARRLFPGEDPLGKVVELQLVPDPRPMEVVGVVGDVRLSRLEEEPEAALYVPYLHHPRTVMRIAMGVAGPPQSVADSFREVVRSLDPEVPLSRVAPLEALVSGSLAERRALTLALTLLAFLPLLLASVGLFAVLAYHVSRRRHEMGIRLALGAGQAHVGGLVLGQGLRLVLVGVALGMGGGVAGARVLRGLLFGVEATDPATFLAVAGLVLGVAALACAAPVWRAVRSDPRVALQAE